MWRRLVWGLSIKIKADGSGGPRELSHRDKKEGTETRASIYYSEHEQSGQVVEASRQIPKGGANKLTSSRVEKNRAWQRAS